MTDCINIFNDTINLDKNNQTLLSRILPDHKPMIADYLGSLAFKHAWNQLLAELYYITDHHFLGLIAEPHIYQYTSTPSRESFRKIDSILEELNCTVINEKINAIGIHSTDLDLNNVYITRLPIRLFQMEGYVDFWKNLTFLSCSNKKLTTLDLSPLTTLEALDLSNNQVTTLKLNGLTALRELECQNNKISILDLQNLISLERLWCENNPLKVLNLTGAHPNLLNEYQPLALLLKFAQLRKADSDEARSIIINSLGSDYTYANCLLHCPTLAIQSFLSSAVNTLQNLKTSAFAQAASFLPGFGANNDNHHSQNGKKRPRSEEESNHDPKFKHPRKY